MRHFHCLLAHVLVQWIFFLGAGGAEVSVHRGYLRRTDPLVEEAFGDPLVTCTCNCCMTQARLPGEEKNGLTTKCTPQPTGFTETCPAMCKKNKEDMHVVAAKGGMDYGRYCMLKCDPMEPIVGSKCERKRFRDYDVEDDTGNGTADTGPIFPANTGADDGDKEDKDSMMQAKKELAEESQETPLHIKYDITEVIRQSKQAQAAASIANAASSLSHADVDAARGKTTLAALLHAVHVMTPTANLGMAAEMDVKNEADDAEEAVESSRPIRHAANVEAHKAAKKAEKLAVKEIQSGVKALAEREAKADVTRFAWDKPEMWPRYLAVHAADPYLREMVTAVQRVSEYDGVAKGLIGKAKGAQGKAKTLATSMNLYTSQGDLVTAAKMKTEIEGLLASAAGFEKEAKNYWKTADDTRQTIMKWQKAGSMAAAYTAFDFKTQTAG